MRLGMVFPGDVFIRLDCLDCRLVLLFSEGESLFSHVFDDQ